jgi:hypothetical protein
VLLKVGFEVVGVKERWTAVTSRFLRQHPVRRSEVFSGISDELRVARMIDRFYSDNDVYQPEIVVVNVFEQFCLRIGWSCNENRAGVCQLIQRLREDNRDPPRRARSRPSLICDGCVWSDDPDVTRVVRTSVGLRWNTRASWWSIQITA